MTTPFKESRSRAVTQTKTILKMLQENKDGVTNARLLEVSLRYQSVIGAMVRDGYDIVVENLGDGLCKYYLRNEPEILEPKYEGTAKEELFKEIVINHHGVVTSEQVVNILNDLSLTLAKKIRKRVV